MTIQQVLQVAVQHQQSGRLGEAETLYRQLLVQQPRYAPALHLYGLLAHQMGRSEEAADLIRRAIEADPTVPDCYNNLGVVLAAQGRIDEAVAAHRHAVALRPNYAEAHYNLGYALLSAGRAAEAIVPLQQAAELRPDNAETHFNLANALGRSGAPSEAIAEYERALAIQPDHAEAQWNLSLLLLLTGDFSRGWPLYESRWASSPIPKHRRFPQPLWDGAPLNGRRILLLPEQGMGDIIQFIRYVPLVRQRGGHVIFQTPPPLRRLLEGQAQIDELVTLGEPLPAFDVHYPLLSLPGLLGTTLATIPAEVPDLFPDPEQAARWRQRMSEDAPRLKVGLVWAGRPTHPFDRDRSIPLSDLAVLANVPNVRYFSLQKGEASGELRNSPFGSNLIDWTAELNDFADTAALMANLDLVISCDTSVAHLAGAMGRPVWVLLPSSPDWRWLLERTDSPWYPTLRLYRQSRPGDWSHPLAHVARDLEIQQRVK